MAVWWFLGGMVSAEMPPPSFRQGVRMVPPDSSVSVEELCWLLVSWWDMTSSALLCRWTKQWLCPIKTSHLGRRFAQLVEQVSHVQRLCPRCSRPGFDSRPGSLCCVSLPLSLTLFPVQLFSFPINKAKRPKKKKKRRATCTSAGAEWRVCQRYVCAGVPAVRSLILDHCIQCPAVHSNLGPAVQPSHRIFTVQAEWSPRRPLTDW